MRISSSTPSLQMLKAQQAWEARRTRQSAQPEAQTETVAPQPLQKQSPIADESLALSSSTGASVDGQWSQTVQDVQRIAQKAGYVGVTEQDIRRAYTLGESLLADYRV